MMEPAQTVLMVEDDVELIERMPLDAQGLVLRSVTTDGFTARIETSGSTVNATPAASPEPKLQSAYAHALGGRAVALSQPLGSKLAGRLFPRLADLVQKPIEIRIALRSGAILILEMRSPFALSPFGLPIGLGAGLFGTVVALLALIVMQRETRPLARLAAAIDRVDLGDQPAPLPDVRRSAPEIRAVVLAFARLQSRLAELLQARMVLVGGIAHDVRTFATRLRLRVEAIPDAGERSRAIADIDDMIVLLDDSLLASRAGASDIQHELVILAELVEREVDDRSVLGAAVDVWIADTARQVAVLGDRLALRRVIANIVDNAIKYGKAAHLGLEKVVDQPVLTIDDDGPSIPNDKRLALFEPFTRLDASRNRKTGGAGLGLAVARSLIEAYGGTIEITDGVNGARVVVRLPIFHTGHLIEDVHG